MLGPFYARPPMNLNKAAEIAVRDPLSAITRKERTYLLGTSILAFAFVHAGLLPVKIAALGVEFSQTDQKALFRLVAIIVGYFLAAFLGYGVSDFITHRVQLFEILFPQRFTIGTAGSTPPKMEADKRPIPRFSHIASVPASIFRVLLDFIAPVAAGGYALWILLHAI